MILHRVLRPQTPLRAAFSRASPLRNPTQIRRKHYVPVLDHQKAFEENGIQECLSPESFEMAWTQYQGFLTAKLNALTEGTRDEPLDTGNLVGKYARHPNSATLFNYASMAHNNHFFFQSTAPSPVPIPQKLREGIEDSCSSMDSLRAEFIATANGMFGPGFVWLVKSVESGSYHILATYLAGSPYLAAHYRRQSTNMSTYPDYPSSDRTYGSVGRYSTSVPEGTAEVQPIFCVNTWEHVWLRDWGVADKEGFLNAWWEVIDWEHAAQRDAQIIPRSTTGVGKGRRSIFI